MGVVAAAANRIKIKCNLTKIKMNLMDRLNLVKRINAQRVKKFISKNDNLLLLRNQIKRACP